MTDPIIDRIIMDAVAAYAMLDTLEYNQKHDKDRDDELSKKVYEELKEKYTNIVNTQRSRIPNNGNDVDWKRLIMQHNHNDIRNTVLYHLDLALMRHPDARLIMSAENWRENAYFILKW